MNISSPFIQRPIMTTLVMFAVLLVGVSSYFKLPVSNMPDIEYPTINVGVGFPGANPDTMANNVATPLEKEFLTIDGLLSATSSNTLGATTIILQFDLNKNIDAAAQDVQAAIARAAPNLPPNLPNAPTYRKVNPALSPIIILALTSDTIPIHVLYDYANIYIGQQLTLISGVAQVITYGSPFAVRVQMDPGKLASTETTLLDVSNALSNGNPYLSTGFFDGEIESSTILVNGQLYNAAEYNQLIVSYVNNAPLRIQDLGSAVDSLQNYRYSLNYLDKDLKVPGVVLAILPQPSSNAVQISKDMNKILPKIIEQLPASVNLRIVNDKTDSVEESIREVQMTLLIAFVLIVMIIFIYLGKIRETIIPAIALPISVVGTFAIIHLFKFNLDNLSLLALILASGFIIDDAIVVIENIVRHTEAGESPWVAALEGSKQIGFTIVSMTLSLIAVFIPLLFMGGLLGKVLAEFAVTLTTITILSGFISLTLTPMLCSFFIHARNGQEKKHMGDRINTRMLEKYRPALRWILDHRPVALGVLIITMVGSLWLLLILPRDFFPSDDIGFFIVYCQSAEGTSSKRMEELQSQVAEIVRQDPNIAQFVSIAASSLFRNGILYVRLKPHSERKPVLEVIASLQKKTAKVVGINTYYKNIPLIDLSIGSQVRGAYQYALRSSDPKKLYPIAARFVEKMQGMKEIQGVNSDLEINNPQIYVDIPRDKAYSLGVNAQDIELTFELAYAGGRVTRMNTAISQYDVILELEPKYQNDPAALQSIYLRTDQASIPGGSTNATSQTQGSYTSSPQQNITASPLRSLQNMVPINAVINWYEGVGPTSVNHINQFPAVTVSFNLKEGAALSDVLKEFKKIEHETLSTDVTGNVIGAAQTFNQSIKSAALLLIVTIVVIYIVLGVLYESFIHPITILTTLPPAMFGGLIVLLIFHLPLSLYSFLGLILLIGIVKKNGIMMVDFAIENIREKGDSPEQSIFDACMVRFRPIMMTTLTAIFGALPIAFGWGAGAEARRPLGLVIIGGLLFSQLVTLFITPVIYLYLEKINEKVTIQSAENREKARQAE